MYQQRLNKSQHQLAVVIQSHRQDLDLDQRGSRHMKRHPSQHQLAGSTQNDSSDSDNEQEIYEEGGMLMDSEKPENNEGLISHFCFGMRDPRGY